MDLAAAKAEGKVVGYGVLNDAVWKALNEQNQKKVGIPLENWRATTERVIARIETEKGGGQHLVDFVNLGSDMEAMVKAGAFQKFPPETLRLVPEKWRDPNGYWAIVALSPISFLYNTKLVPESEAPKSLTDVLDPKWKGKIALSDPTLSLGYLRWFYAIQQQMGEDKAHQFFTGLAAQNPTMFESGPSVATNVSQGQFALGLAFVAQIVAVGGPTSNLSYIKSNPLFGSVQAFALATNPPHPNAARAMADVIVSPEFLQSFGELGNPVTVPGVKSAVPGLDDLTIEVLPEPPQDKADKMLEYLKGIFRT